MGLRQRMPEGFGVFRAFERGVHHHIRAIKTERERGTIQRIRGRYGNSARNGETRIGVIHTSCGAARLPDISSVTLSSSFSFRCPDGRPVQWGIRGRPDRRASKTDAWRDQPRAM